MKNNNLLKGGLGQEIRSMHFKYARHGIRQLVASCVALAILTTACGGKEDEDDCPAHWQVSSSQGDEAVWMPGQGVHMRTTDPTQTTQLALYQDSSKPMSANGLWFADLYFENFRQQPASAVGEMLTFFVDFQRENGQWENQASIILSRGTVTFKFNETEDSFIVPNNVGIIESGEVRMEKMPNGQIFLEVWMNNSRVNRSMQNDVDNNAGPIRLGVGLGTRSYAAGNFEEISVLFTSINSSMSPEIASDDFSCNSVRP